MANGQDNSSGAQTWRPGSLSVAHLALGFSVLVSTAMAILTVGL